MTLRNPAADAGSTLKALSHPLRVQILAALEHEVKSPNELSKLLDAPLGNIAYHARRLEALGLVKLVEQTPRRGAVEHYYKLEDRPVVADAAWAPTSGVVRNALVGAVLGQVGEDVNAAAAAGGFDREETHASRARGESQLTGANGPQPSTAPVSSRTVSGCIRSASTRRSPST